MGAGKLQGVPSARQSQSEILTAAQVQLTTGTPANVTSLTLPKGRWALFGNIRFQPNGATTIASVTGWIHSVSADFPTLPNAGAYAGITGSLTTGAGQTLPIGRKIVNITVETTFYLTALSSFGTNVMHAFGTLVAEEVP